MKVKSMEAHVLIVGVNETGEVLVREGQGPMSCHLVQESKEDLVAGEVRLRPDAVLKGHVIATAVDSAHVAHVADALARLVKTAEEYEEAVHANAGPHYLNDDEAARLKRESDANSELRAARAAARRVLGAKAVEAGRADQERLLEGRTMAEWYMEAKSLLKETRRLEALVDDLKAGQDAADANAQSDESARESMVKAHARSLAQKEKEIARLDHLVGIKQRENERLDALLENSRLAETFLTRTISSFNELVEAKTEIRKIGVEDIRREIQRSRDEADA